MKKILFSICLAFGFFSCSKAQKTEFTSEALADKMLTTDGIELTFEAILKKYEGKTVLIDVWASWCPDCIKGMPKVENLQKAYPDVVYLFLSYDKTPESWAKGIEKYQVKGEHYLILSKWKGGTFSNSIDLDWIPRYMVLDKTGKIKLYKAIEADDEKIISTLNQLK
ncbi:TlpA family protein disulfide reductase [Flavobacterium sp.]|uniref:TlpA family protein disulfide reductase n=1 Tax=Flavobacterium sp. TaxID=239 RepID=UPI002FDA9097